MKGINTSTGRRWRDAGDGLLNWIGEVESDRAGFALTRIRGSAAPGYGQTAWRSTGSRVEREDGEHVSRAGLEKLGMRTTAELMRYAMRIN